MKKYWQLEAKDEEEAGGPTMMAGSSDDSRVSVEHNRIYFYSGVTRQDNLTLNKLLKSTGQKLANIKNVYKLDQPPKINLHICLLYTSPSPGDLSTSRMPSSA